jgi:hypothetical protein
MARQQRTLPVLRSASDVVLRLTAAPLELLSCGLSWLAGAALCLGFLILMV